MLHLRGLHLLKAAETLLASMGAGCEEELVAPTAAAIAVRKTQAEMNLQIAGSQFWNIFHPHIRAAPDGWVMFWDDASYMDMDMKLESMSYFTTETLLADPFNKNRHHAVYTNVFYEYLIFFVCSTDAATGGATAEIWKLGGKLTACGLIVMVEFAFTRIDTEWHEHFNSNKKAMLIICSFVSNSSCACSGHHQRLVAGAPRDSKNGPRFEGLVPLFIHEEQLVPIVWETSDSLP